MFSSGLVVSLGRVFVLVMPRVLFDATHLIGDDRIVSAMVSGDENHRDDDQTNRSDDDHRSGSENHTDRCARWNCFRSVCVVRLLRPAPFHCLGPACWFGHARSTRFVVSPLPQSQLLSSIFVVHARRLARDRPRHDQMGPQSGECETHSQWDQTRRPTPKEQQQRMKMAHHDATHHEHAHR